MQISGCKKTRPSVTDSRLAQGVLIVLLCMILGCGSPDTTYDVVAVQGSVAYEDGTPIPGLRVTFVSQSPSLNEKTHPRPGVAGIADDGMTIEQVTTYKFGDGLITGKHKVVVKSKVINGPPNNAVHPKYSSAKTTPLTVDTAEIPFSIKIEKPSSRR